MPMPIPIPTDACIFHISNSAEVLAALRCGEHRAPSLASEGFIHFSCAHQVLDVARAFYAGQSGLVLMVVDTGLLTAPLRYEAPAHPSAAAGAAGIAPAQLFPHLYGPLNADAILDTVELERFDGSPVHPDTAAVLRHYRFERLPVEGSLYKSTWRAQATSTDGSPAGTAMLGLYAHSPESVSCFHRLAHDEVWHVYGGDPFVLYLLHPDGSSGEVLMGSNPLAGECAQFVVTSGVWQAGCLVPGGRYALFGCTMAPGFTGGCFEAGIADALAQQYPERADVIRRLSVNGNVQHMPAGFAD